MMTVADDIVLHFEGPSIYKKKKKLCLVVSIQSFIAQVKL